MKSWDAFYPWVLPEVNGCPLPTINRALCDAAREFCTATAAWWEQSDTLVPDGVTQRFEFDIPSGAELVRVLSATVNDDPMDVLPSEELPADWQTTVVTEPCDSLIHISLTEYLLIPVPTGRIDVKLAFKPTLLGSGVGDDVFNKYAEVVACGAKAKLMAMPAAWANPVVGQMHRQMFDKGIHSAANEGSRLKGRLRSKPWG